MSCLVRMGIGPNAGRNVRVPHLVGVNLIERGDAVDAMAGTQPEPMAGPQTTPQASPKRRRRKAKG